MNYKMIYQNLIDKGRAENTSEEYFERHHIVPRCMGGSNAKSNIVRLTPEQHYVAHQLLVKMHPSDKNLTAAAVLMTGSKFGVARNNKLYGWLRRRFIESISGVNSSRLGQHLSKEARARIGKANSGDKNHMRRCPENAISHGIKMRGKNNPWCGKGDLFRGDKNHMFGRKRPDLIARNLSDDHPMKLPKNRASASTRMTALNSARWANPVNKAHIVGDNNPRKIYFQNKNRAFGELSWRMGWGPKFWREAYARNHGLEMRIAA